MANRTYHPRGQLVHGFAAQEHPLYTTWANMLSRCYNPENNHYHNYGGRGISIDPTWHHFANFAKDMGLKPDPKLTLGRADNERGYSKANCVWGTRTEQAWNRRTFKSNTSGYRGVVQVKDRFEARFDYEKTRHIIGRFESAKTAALVREAFVGLFFRDRPAALEMLAVETLWRTSSTKVRGVTPHADGGFIARTTIKGVREYLGYFPTIELAAAAISERKKQKWQTNSQT